MTFLQIEPITDHSEPGSRVAPAVRAGRARWRGRIVRSVVGLVALLVMGNATILAASAMAKSTIPGRTIEVPADVAAIHNFVAIDAKLWRGGAPGADGYRALAAAGVTTIVDLRAEHGLDIPEALFADLGLARVAIPIRDGQAPTPDQVRRFLDAVEASSGTVYLHCGAGVGRTGTMAAAYRVSQGDRGWDAMRANLAVGPPSLEQLAFAASLHAGRPAERPPVALVAASRVLDAPRRIWKVVEDL